MPATQLLDALRATFAPQAESKGLDLRFSAPPDVWLDTDPRLLQSMADNLVSNALRYTQAGGARPPAALAGALAPGRAGHRPRL